MSQTFCHGDVTSLVIPQGFSDLTGVASSGQLPGGAPTGSGVVVMQTSPTIASPTITGTESASNITASGTVTAKRLTTHSGTALVSGNIALSAGWGTSPTLAINRGTDQAASIQITAKATVGANPTVIVTFADGTFTQIPVVVACRTDVVGANSTPTAAITNQWAVTTVTATAVTFTFVGTPVANSVYGLAWIALGT